MKNGSKFVNNFLLPKNSNRPKTKTSSTYIKTMDDLDNDKSLGYYSAKKNKVGYLKIKSTNSSNTELSEILNDYEKYDLPSIRNHERRHWYNQKVLNNLSHLSFAQQSAVHLHNEISARISQLLRLRYLYRHKRREFLKSRYSIIEVEDKYLDFLRKENSLETLIPSEAEVNIILQDALSSIDYEKYCTRYKSQINKEIYSIKKNILRKFGKQYSFDEIIKHLYTFKSENGQSFNLLSLLTSSKRDDFFTQIARNTAKHTGTKPLMFIDYLINREL